MKQKNKNRKNRIWIWIILFAVISFTCIRLVIPGHTPKLKGENSVALYSSVEINGNPLQVLIRGENRNNRVLLFVHGGPCCSEIPYERKYMRELEQYYTVVLYDQRGSGKSCKLGKDYSDITAEDHVADLILLTEYIESYLGAEQVVLLGHSFGTYIAMQAAAQRPELYLAYVGMGQMSDTVQSELSTLAKCIRSAKNSGDAKSADKLESLTDAVSRGDRIVPRKYVRKYGFAARQMNDNLDYWMAFLFGAEYNLFDGIRMYAASFRYQEALITEALNAPISEIITEMKLPVYFLMGSYDGMTSPEAAEAFLQTITGDAHKETVLFEASAHYPQFEEADRFCQWLLQTFPVTE